MRNIITNSTFLIRVKSFLRGIYLGQFKYMQNRAFWRLHRLTIWFRLGCGLFKKKNIKKLSSRNRGEIIYLDPARIKYVLLRKENDRDDFATVESGNWDLEIGKIEDSYKYISFMNYLINNKMVTNNEKDEGKYFKKNYDSDYNKVDKLFKEIKADGYQSQEDLGINNPLEEIKVQISRNGKFLLDDGLDGLDRLAIASALNIHKIPVYVSKRHYKWALFRDEVYSYSQEQPKGAYQQVIHPDFQNFKFHRKNDDRWDMIVNNLPLKNGTVLDLGSNWGYFCHKFDEFGFSCYAVENNYRWLYFLQKFRDIEDRSFEIIPRSLFDIKRKNYDIILALSIFHNLLWTKDMFDMLTTLISKLEMKVMFFEPHITGEGHKVAEIDFTEEEFVDYVINTSCCLTNSKYLGKSKRGRSLYLLT